MRFSSLVLLLVTSTAIVAPANAKRIANADLKYEIDLPDACRHEEGPGTLEAVCSPDMNADKSRDLQAAGAVVFEIDAEAVPADAKPYTEIEFRQDLVEGVCGESDAAKVKLSDVASAKEGAATVFRANVICPEIKFLGLPERTAEARFYIAPTMRYRLMTRAPSDDVPAIKPAADAFLRSFKLKTE